MDLASKKCVPCHGGTPRITAKEVETLAAAIPGWTVAEGDRLERSFKFSDFKSALAFTNQVGEIAEAEDHHPDIHLSWGRVRIVIWTHAVGGLTENDFILAAKIDQLGFAGK
jgi:4a-hydroxytetrahydrobiopterin dehydratase